MNSMSGNWASPVLPLSRRRLLHVLLQEGWQLHGALLPSCCWRCSCSPCYSKYFLAFRQSEELHAQDAGHTKALQSLHARLYRLCFCRVSYEGVPMM